MIRYPEAKARVDSRTTRWIRDIAQHRIETYLRLGDLSSASALANTVLNHVFPGRWTR